MGTSVEMYGCVSLTRLKADACATMNSSPDDSASACVAGCALSHHAYALINGPSCFCVQSEFYKLTDLVDKEKCEIIPCSDYSRLCGGFLPDPNNNGNDCRYQNYQIRLYSFFIANPSGMPNLISSVFDF